MENEKKFENWLETEQKRVSILSNRELFDEYTGLAGGDNCYDGCFTCRGEVTFCCLSEELQTRLADWFDKDECL